jgi:hypothetical protein
LIHEGIRKTQSSFLAFVSLGVASWINLLDSAQVIDLANYPLKLGLLWKINYRRVLQNAPGPGPVDGVKNYLRFGIIVGFTFC